MVYINVGKFPSAFFHEFVLFLNVEIDEILYVIIVNCHLNTAKLRKKDRNASFRRMRLALSWGPKSCFVLTAEKRLAEFGAGSILAVYKKR